MICKRERFRGLIFVQLDTLYIVVRIPGRRNGSGYINVPVPSYSGQQEEAFASGIRGALERNSGGEDISEMRERSEKAGWRGRKRR